MRFKQLKEMGEDKDCKDRLDSIKTVAYMTEKTPEQRASHRELPDSPHSRGFIAEAEFEELEEHQAREELDE